MSTPNTCSWNIKKILESRIVVHQAGGWHKALKHNQFSIGKKHTIMGDFPKVPWKEIVV